MTLSPRQRAIRYLAVASMRSGNLVEFTAPDGPLYTSEPILGKPGVIVPTRSSLALRYYGEAELIDPFSLDGLTTATVSSERFEAIPVSIYARTCFRYE